MKLSKMAPLKKFRGFKMQKNTPKILSISLSTWHKDSGIHTQTDLFKFYDKNKIAQIYTKSDLPNTPVCNSFFRISENEIIKSVIKRNAVGKRVYNGQKVDEATQKAIKEEAALYTKAHKKKSWTLTLARELVWSLGKWKTKALQAFIDEENPDIYFIPIYPVIYMGKLQLYILKKHPKPYVCYLWDDNFSYKPCRGNLLSYIHRYFLRKTVKKLAVNCTEMFTMTSTQKKEIDSEFNINSILLTKGINYDNLEFKEKELSSPIRMVYTGNLFIGRAASLVEISKALAEINKDGEKITLDIYSPTVMDSKTMEYLNSNGCHFNGNVPKSEVDSIQQSADIVVFVESLKKDHRFDARLSFSTKLTDYFKNGKCIFAIGDKTIAPIEYLRQNDCAIIANEYNEIAPQLKRIIDNPEIIKDLSRKSFDCGKKNHNENDIKRIFVDTFVKASEKGKHYVKN